MSEQQAGYMTGHVTVDWHEDARLSEQQDGDMLRLWLVSRRRALITELRELEQILGVESALGKTRRQR